MRTIKLCQGVGTKGQSHCVMAATSIVADEDFTDRPECVCPTITAALIVINDACPNDGVRERLLSHLPWLIIGTKSSDFDHIKRRNQLFYSYSYNNVDTPALSHFFSDFDLGSFAKNTAIDVASRAGEVASAAVAARAGDDYVVLVAHYTAWEAEVKKFIDFIEEKIIPVYTTMPIEPAYNIERLITNE